VRAWLLFLGKIDDAGAGNRLLEPPALSVGDCLELELRHPERWRRQDVTRVIVGSEPTWADLVLIDEQQTIRREHARFYLNHRFPESSDFRAMKQCPVSINGQPHLPFEWVNLRNGDEIQLSCWRFRYEWAA
jgi:hypothetical protein